MMTGRAGACAPPTTSSEPPSQQPIFQPAGITSRLEIQSCQFFFRPGLAQHLIRPHCLPKKVSPAIHFCSYLQVLTPAFVMRTPPHTHNFSLHNCLAYSVFIDFFFPRFSFSFFLLGSKNQVRPNLVPELVLGSLSLVPLQPHTHIPPTNSPPAPPAARHWPLITTGTTPKHQNKASSSCETNHTTHQNLVFFSTFFFLLLLLIACLSHYKTNNRGQVDQLPRSTIPPYYAAIPASFNAPPGPVLQLSGHCSTVPYQFSPRQAPRIRLQSIYNCLRFEQEPRSLSTIAYPAFSPLLAPTYQHPPSKQQKQHRQFFFAEWVLLRAGAEIRTCIPSHQDSLLSPPTCAPALVLQALSDPSASCSTDIAAFRTLPSLCYSLLLPIHCAAAQLPCA